MKVYRFLAYAIATLVVVQMIAIAWAFFGLGAWVRDDGGVVNKAYLESEGGDIQFVAEWGFAIHMFFVGLVLIPLLTIALLVTSFFAKVPRGIAMAATMFVLVLLQVIVLPMLSREVGSFFGALHGLNAVVLLGVGLYAGRQASSPAVAAPAGTQRSVPA